MSSTVFDLVWQDIVSRQWALADEIDKARYPEVSSQAMNEVAEFALLPSPNSGHELNVRRVFAYAMMTNWQSLLNRSTSSHSQ